MVPHPAAGLDMRLRCGLDSFAAQSQPFPQCIRITGALTMCRPICPATIAGVALQSAPQAKHRLPVPLHTVSGVLISEVEFQTDHRYRPVVLEVRGLRLSSPPRHHHITAGDGRGVGARGCHVCHAITDHRHRSLATPMAKPIAAHRAQRPARLREAAWRHPVLIRVLVKWRALGRTRTAGRTRGRARDRRRDRHLELKPCDRATHLSNVGHLETLGTLSRNRPPANGSACPHPQVRFGYAGTYQRFPRADHPARSDHR
jgi:hypothetical protein